MIYELHITILTDEPMPEAEVDAIHDAVVALLGDHQITTAGHVVVPRPSGKPVGIAWRLLPVFED